MMKNRNQLFSALFTILILIVGAYVMFIKPPTVRLAMELRNATTFIGPTFQNVREGYFQSTFEKAFSDQFIKRQTILTLDNMLEYTLYKVSIVDQKGKTLIKIGDDVYTFEENDDYLTGWPLLKNENTIQGIVNFTENINAIAEKYSNVHFYVFKPFRITESNWFDEDNKFISYGQTYHNQFVSSLSDKVLYGDNQIGSFEEYKKYYYKTDPHWNIEGSTKAYQDIAAMLSFYYEDIEPRQPQSKYCIPDFDYYGQYGRNSTYLTKPDEFCDFTFDLPEYKTFINGVEGEYDRKEEFINKTIEDFYWNYIYSVFHGNDESEILFKENQATGRVLLAFVDSYSSPIKNLIASHFDDAYFIDPRINKDFNFKEFMESHSVTDVMYIGFYGSLYNDASYIFEEY